MHASAAGAGAAHGDVGAVAEQARAPLQAVRALTRAQARSRAGSRAPRLGSAVRRGGGCVAQNHNTRQSVSQSHRRRRVNCRSARVLSR